MVHLVALLQPAQDGDGVLHRGLGRVDGLEPPLQRGVLLDALAVLVQRGGPDGAQLPARKGGLEQVGGVHGPFGRAGADERVQLVDEKDDLALAVDDLLEDRLEALLELAAELRPGNQAPEVQGEQPLVLQRIRDVTGHDPPGQPLHDGGLADTRLPDEDGVVLRPAGQHLHDAPDLLVPADDGVQLLLAGELGEVTGVFLQGLVARLGVLVRHPLVAAHRLQRFQDPVPCHAACLQEVPRLAAGLQDCQQQVLGARELVLQGVGFLLRLVQRLATAAESW